ncbi:MAG: heavy metal translocating P-type ATPase, partial [Lachnospiraceae bacterium]|nr:heavy metal translocating P-type ATPase [Lachnospiraceae bacterium]
MNKKQKRALKKIIIAIVLIILIKLSELLIDYESLLIGGFALGKVILFALYMIPYLAVGADILKKAFKGIRNRQVFDENFLMAVATLGAIAVALAYSGDYTEAVAVMLFYQIGELFQSIA